MQSSFRYLTFGLVVLAAYWMTVQRGYVYFGGSATPTAPGAHAAGGSRGRPTFWSTGYQGGK
jgi:hypothetical protein